MPSASVFIILTLLYAPFALSMTRQPCDEQHGAKLVSLQGQLFYDPGQNGAWQEAGLNDLLCEGARLRVAQYSRASLTLPGGVTLRLDEGTVLSLNGIAASDATLLDLLKGFIHFISRTPKQLTITTPIANAGPEGTEFALGVDQQTASLSVTEGSVKFFNQYGNLHLSAGESAGAQSGSSPSMRIDLKPQDAVQWALYYPPLIPELSQHSNGLLPILQLYRQGRINLALEQLTKIPADPSATDFIRLRSSLLMIAGRIELATADIDRLSSMNAKDAHALALSAVAALTRNRKSEALEFANRALTSQPDSTVANIASSYVEQAHFHLDSALTAMIRASELSADDPLVWARRAELEQALGQTEASEISAQRALRLDSNLERARTVMGFVRLSRLQFGQAREDFETAIGLDSISPLARLGLGLSKIRQGLLSEGRNDLEIAAILDPNQSLIRSYLGKAYYEERRQNLAEDQFQLAKQLDPKDPTAYFYDAINKQTTNRPTEAIADMQKAIELNDNRAVYRSKMELDEDDATRTANLARMYNDLGFGRLAYKEAWSALNEDDDNPTAHRFLSDAYWGKSRFRTARASELLQAQLLQPLNITPVQPQLSSENIGILNNTGPGSIGLNEYDPLYTRNSAHLVANGAYGSRNTITSNLVASGIYDSLSLSGGQFHYQTDGFRPNNDYRQDAYDAFAQYAFSPHFNLQVELKSENLRAGDVITRLNELYLPNFRHDTNKDTARIGGKFKVNDRQSLIGSFIYTRLQDLNQDKVFGILDPLDISSSFDASINTGASLKSQQSEIQYNFNDELLSLKAGFGFLNIDSQNRDASIARWSFLNQPWPDASYSLSSTDKTQNYNGYVYLNPRSFETLKTTLGASYDDYNDGQTKKQQLNPKIGFIWQPEKDLWLRAAFLRTLKRPLATQQTIEPTQIAGFNQFYDSTNGTSAWQYGTGIDYVWQKKIFLGGEIVWRNLKEPLFSGTESLNRQKKEIASTAYLYWSATDWLSFSSEYQFVQYSRAFAHNEFNAYDPQSVATHQFPLATNFFLPNGLFARLTATHVNQTVTTPQGQANLKSDQETFWTFDAAVGFRLPKKIGVISFEMRNLVNKHFNYQSTFDAEGPQLSPFTPERQLFAKLNFFY
ncbi:MAG: hypothetical protein RL563_1251 [Pseudomonadota bacterium]